jgi:hypothetical protein
MVGPKYLAAILALLAVATLIAAVVLQILGDDNSNEWTAFLSFSAALLALHIPSPAQAAATTTTTPSS